MKAMHRNTGSRVSLKQLLSDVVTLDRFTTSYDHVHAAWIAERATARSAQAIPTEGSPS